MIDIMCLVNFIVEISSCHRLSINRILSKKINALKNAYVTTLDSQIPRVHYPKKDLNLLCTKIILLFSIFITFFATQRSELACFTLVNSRITIL